MQREFQFQSKTIKILLVHLDWQMDKCLITDLQISFVLGTLGEKEKLFLFLKIAEEREKAQGNLERFDDG